MLSPTSPVAALYEPTDYFRRLEKSEIFSGSDQPLEIDLGCGDGNFLIELAAHHPDRNFLGIERLLGRAQKVPRKARRLGLINVKAFRIDAAYAVSFLLPEASIARLHLLFPDPWPKKKHHKNRLVTDAICLAVHRLLEPNGEWLFKTDHSGYFAEAVESIRGTRLFDELPWSDEDFFYPATDFERQWIGQGRTVERARFRRRR